MLKSNGRIEFIVPRHSSEEITFALVSLDNNEAFETVDDVKQAIIHAVNEWFKTEEGKIVKSETSNDFNVGDLAYGLDTQQRNTLNVFLEREGIKNLRAECFVGLESHSWEFDDHLFDEE